MEDRMTQSRQLLYEHIYETLVAFNLYEETLTKITNLCVEDGKCDQKIKDEFVIPPNLYDIRGYGVICPVFRDSSFENTGEAIVAFYSSTDSDDIEWWIDAVQDSVVDVLEKSGIAAYKVIGTNDKLGVIFSRTGKDFKAILEVQTIDNSVGENSYAKLSVLYDDDFYVKMSPADMAPKQVALICEDLCVCNQHAVYRKKLHGIRIRFVHAQTKEEEAKMTMGVPLLITAGNTSFSIRISLETVAIQQPDFPTLDEVYTFLKDFDDLLHDSKPECKKECEECESTTLTRVHRMRVKYPPILKCNTCKRPSKNCSIIFSST